MEKALQTLVEAIKEDYSHFGEDCHIRQQMIEEFNESFEITYGSKYTKIIVNRSVWGFIVATDNDKKFRRGDILKAAGYSAPARNSARGNIYDGGYTIRWTGPLYLK